MINDKPAPIEIRELLISDLQSLIELWNKDPKDYNKYFIPFEMNYENFKGLLNKAEKDFYMGVFVKNDIAGFFMLRGFDEGYQIPSYGVWISSKYANKGLAKLSLVYSISICRVLNIKKIMLKVHPDNKIALTMYKKFGFIETGIDERIGHIIMHKDLD